MDLDLAAALTVARSASSGIPLRRNSRHCMCVPDVGLSARCVGVGRGQSRPWIVSDARLGLKLAKGSATFIEETSKSCLVK